VISTAEASNSIEETPNGEVERRYGNYQTRDSDRRNPRQTWWSCFFGKWDDLLRAVVFEAAKVPLTRPGPRQKPTSLSVGVMGAP
jgi:hypothetical protein